MIWLVDVSLDCNFMLSQGKLVLQHGICSHYQLACIHHDRGNQADLSDRRSFDLDKVTGGGSEGRREQIDCTWSSEMRSVRAHVISCTAF